jgi:hypothetical protein
MFKIAEHALGATAALVLSSLLIAAAALPF